jgi:hypothetical protein
MPNFYIPSDSDVSGKFFGPQFDCGAALDSLSEMLDYTQYTLLRNFFTSQILRPAH